MADRRLKCAEKAIVMFSANTKKSPNRLLTALAVRLRLESLDEFWKAYRAAVTEVADSGGDYADEEFYATEEAYRDAQLELRTMLQNFEVVPPANGVQAQQQQQNQGIRMKAIDAPEFSGDIEDWVSFRDLFSTLIGTNNTLTPVHRLQYLKIACKGQAADVIRNIEVTNVNYQIAWNALVRRYENPRRLISRQIERLLDLPTMTRECPDELRRLLDGTTQTLEALRALNQPTAEWDSLIVVQTARKLDAKTRLEWEKSISSTTAMPNFAALDMYLIGVLRSFEAVKPVGGGESQASGSNYRGNDRRTVRTHVVASRTIECMLCSNAHPLHRCPILLEKSVQARRAFVEHRRICFNCLGTTEHESQACWSRFRCAICKDKHHTMLHESFNDSTSVRVNPFKQQQQISQAENKRPAAAAAAAAAASTTEGGSVSTNVCQSTVANGVLLPTAWVTLVAQNGRTIKVRALIDQASEATLITERVVQKLAATKSMLTTDIKGVGGASAGTTANCVSVAVSSCLEGEREHVNVTALVMRKVTSQLPSRLISRSQMEHLDGLQLADPYFNQPGDVDLLLGANAFSGILLDGVQHGGRNDIVAQRTIFGWIVTGRAIEAQPSSTVVSLHVRLDELLQKFWETEEVPTRSHMSADDIMCEQVYSSTTTRADDGRYVVELPFRQGGRELGESRYSAVRRQMQMEKRGQQHVNMYEGYKQFMRTYIALNHMELIPPQEIDTVNPHCYLPHHAVFKPESSTTKIRVVFDATAATTSGKGLNALLLTGPRLQETLASILMRWRTHRFAISADVEKMYRQIWVQPAHRDFQRIVWRDSADLPMQHYRLKTVTYGTACAPYLAVKTMLRLADDERERYPRAAAVVHNDFYVDDCLSGADTLADAVSLKNELIALMAAGGMRLMKWSSNSSELLRTLPDDHIECRAPLSFDDDDGIKALGIRWYPACDELRYKVRVSLSKNQITKREMLAEISRLFDPLGLLSPVIITAKIHIQRLWLTGLQWDDELPDEVHSVWRKFQDEMSKLEEIRIPRWCNIRGQCKLEMHGFADASMHAYAACVYVRTQDADGVVKVTLMAAKTKVAPIKQQCIPRLELNGAVLLAELMVECRKAIRCNDAVICAWTDSMTVLAWLRKHSNVWPTYIGNRVSKVHAIMDSTQWRHVPGVDNPADVASRGIQPGDLRTHSLWWSGPAWLAGDRDGWPGPTSLVVDASLLEMKKEVTCMITQTEVMYELAMKYSSWMKLLRITAYLRRMIRRRDGPHLQADEMEEARRCWLRLVQQNEYGDVHKLIDDIAVTRQHRLTKLTPFVDNHGLMRVGGRLQNSGLAYDEQHPVILPPQNVITKLIVIHAHEKVFHAGPQNTMGRLHQQYWIVNERKRVRQIVNKCVTCVRARPSTQCQLMGNLPAARVQLTRAFLNTAIDYAGPFWSHISKGRGRRAHKSYIAIFVCLGSKAVHLELVSELSTAAFLAAYRRFASRRGVSTDIYCDNGTNFVGADRELQTHLRAALQDDIWRAELSNNGTRFHFAPPGSPHFNGLAEATVKMAKSAMKKVIGEHKLTFEEMSTFLTQVEAALNSRPLCTIPSAGDETSVLTPGHLLIGQPLTAIPEPTDVAARTPSNRWQLLQHMTQHFWRRWAREYVHQLQQRHKWTQPTINMKIDDVVVIVDDQPFVTRWRIGRIIELHPGRLDGMVRVATVKTSPGNITRTITKLALLPVNTYE